MAHRIAEKLPPKPALRVLHRGDAMVPDYGALMNAAHSTRKFHGRTFDPKAGPEFEDVDGSTKNHGGFVAIPDAPIVISSKDKHYGEYVRHLKDGDLWPADQATADAAGVAFEPDFGGEHEEMAKSEEAVKVRKAREERQARHVADIEAAAKAPKASVDSTVQASK